MINFAINGFGRIGRSAVRVWLDKHLDTLNLTAINTSGSMPVSSWAHLLRHDTAYGLLPYEVEVEEIQDPQSTTDKNPLIGYFKIHTPRQIFRISILAQRDPEKIPYRVPGPGHRIRRGQCLPNGTLHGRSGTGQAGLVFPLPGAKPHLGKHR